MISLLLFYYAGWFFFSPLYFYFLFIFNVKFTTIGHVRGKRPFLCTLNDLNYIFSEVVNISGNSLVYLSWLIWNISHSYANNVRTFWQSNCNKLGTFPPNGWLLKLMMGLFLTTIYIYFIISGYLKIILKVTSH